MQVRADRVSLKGPHGPLLPSTSLTVEEGCLTVVHGEPGVGITALALALAGRLKPTTGTVTADPEGDLRRLVAVVDSPGVSEPDEALPLRVVTGEELALAHRPSSKDAVTAWLSQHDAAPYADSRFENLEPALRIRLLTALAAEREGVRVLVLDVPDRHTSDVELWAAVAREHAARGFAVAVLAATTPESALPFPPAKVGEVEQPDPVRLYAPPEPAEAEQTQQLAETAELTAETENSEGDRA
ncbi:ABC transporter ATP-binding protein [Amycolatopsis echigonensis]|uniref:ABC transporter ATP-binding protein n=1 Tax=Amycolatopsis echigonensis TaxID=2576905 RepID=A0A8E1W980_9PSEU|nr:ABC transporter ATP-binding protein [Amycolatopsis echigonensis]MBB2505775.1 ABC transporter ATP-binding protein [Amycolatopsis echigonensis]